MAVFMRVGSAGWSKWNATECWNSGTNEWAKEDRSPDAKARFHRLSRKSKKNRTRRMRCRDCRRRPGQRTRRRVDETDSWPP